MIPHKLTLRNFMCYRDNVPPLHFDGLNIVCLSGENGAGKSALLDAMTWALWGRARGKSDDELIALGQDDMEVDFEFVLDGALRRVIRRRTKGKRGQTMVDFQVCEKGGSWRRIGGDSVRETDARIAGALRMNYETFINSAFLLQGRADEFTNRRPAERKQVLADILELAVYEDLEARAKTRRAACDDRLRGLDGLIADHEVQVARRPFLLDESARAQATAEKWDAEVAGQESATQTLREEAARLHRLAELRAALEDRLARHAVELQEAQQELIRVEERVAAHERLVARRAEIEAGFEHLQRVQARLEEFARLGDEAHRLNDIKRDHDYALRQIRGELEFERARRLEEAQELRAQADAKETLAAERTTLESEATEFARLRDRLQRLGAEQADLNERYQQISSLRLRVAELRQPLHDMRQARLLSQSELVQKITILEQSAARIPKLERELTEVRRQLLRLQSEDEQLGALREEVQKARLDQQRLDEQRVGLEKLGKEIRDKLHLIETGEGVCPLCERELDQSSQRRLVHEYAAQRDTLRVDFKTVRSAAEAAKATLAEGEPRIERWAKRLTEERRTLEQRRATLEAQVEQATADARSLREHQQTLDTLDRQLASDDYGHAEREKSRVAEAELAALGDPDVVKSELARVGREITALEKKSRNESQFHQRQARVLDALGRASEAAARLPEVETRLAEVERRLEEQDYGHAERAASEAILAAIKALGYTRAEHETLRQQVLEYQPWSQEIVKLEHALENREHDRAALCRSRELIERRGADLANEREEAAVLDAELRGRRSVEVDLATAEQGLRTARSQQNMAQQELGQAKRDLARCDEVAELLKSYREQHAALAGQRGIYEDLVQAFGKKGIQAMLIETAIPELEHEANRLLARMTDNQMHLSFETQRDSKKGDTIETLDIRIADGLGTRDYSMFSGGEAFRVNLAVRVALAKLLAHRADANLKTLVIDEGFGTQDSQGRDRIVEAINAVAQDFERILIITHIQELKDLFPTQIEVTKGADGSSWRLV